MRARRRKGLPWYARLPLMGLRGEGSEYVRGDLEEAYRKLSTGSARMRWMLDALLSVAAWWNPRAVRRRTRLEGKDRPGALRDMSRDLHQGLRSLGRRPAFASVAILTLGVGIAAPATIYSVVDAVVVRGLPYRESSDLVVMGQTLPGREYVEGTELHALVGVSGPTFRDWRERTRTLADMEAIENRTLLVPDQGAGPALVRAANVTAGFFDLLGARLHLGRLFDESDMRGEDAGGLVIMSYSAWMRRTGGDMSILGEPGPGFPGSTVIGVLGEEFEAPEAVFGREGIEFWMPLDLTSDRYAHRADNRLAAMGRLAPGATVTQARTDIASIQADLAREYPEFTSFAGGNAAGVGINSLEAQTVGRTGRTLWLFLASSVLLLLIAAMNTANLLFVRGLDRHKEMAVRLALGASRWRVARSVLIESVILALAGGILGLLMAYAGVIAFVSLVPDSMPRLMEISLNGRILAIGAISSIGVGILAGLAPALRSGRNDFVAHRTEGETDARSGLRLRMSLVSAQLALAVVLGIGASLLFRSFVNVATADPGFESENLYGLTTSLKRGPLERGTTVASMWDELLNHVRAVPGTEIAAATSPPFQTPAWVPAFQMRDDDADARRPVNAAYAITPNYFTVLNVPLAEGRAFTAADGALGQPVVIVNEAFVQAFLPDGAVGERIRIWEQDGTRTEREIVGVVTDIVQVRVEDGPRPALYLPYTQSTLPFIWVVARSAREGGELAAELRAAGRRFNPIVPAPDVERVTERMRIARAEPRFQALLFLSFAGVAILLAAVGLYGTLAHAVGRRTRELGIRMAVGADRSRIFKLIMREGIVVFGAGLGAGLAASLLLTRLLRGFLYGVGPLDALTFATTSVLLAAVAALAMHRPARRATRVDPLKSLRME